MKKLLSVIMVFSMALSLFGCAGVAEEDTAKKAQNSSSVVSVVEEAGNETETSVTDKTYDDISSVSISEEESKNNKDKAEFSEYPEYDIEYDEAFTKENTFGEILEKPDIETIKQYSDLSLKMIEAIKNNDADTFFDIWPPEQVDEEEIGEFKANFDEFLNVNYGYNNLGIEYNSIIKKIYIEDYADLSKEDTDEDADEYIVFYLYLENADGSDNYAMFTFEGIKNNGQYHLIFNEVYSTERYNYMNELKTANGMAKDVYNTVSEFVADLMTRDYEYIFDGDEYDLSQNYSDELGAVLTNEMNYYKMSGIVYVGANYNGDYFVQWRSSEDSDIIGQYPNPISYEDADNVVWGDYYEGY